MTKGLTYFDQDIRQYPNYFFGIVSLTLSFCYSMIIYHNERPLIDKLNINEALHQLGWVLNIDIRSLPLYTFNDQSYRAFSFIMLHSCMLGSSMPCFNLSFQGFISKRIIQMLAIRQNPLEIEKLDQFLDDAKGITTNSVLLQQNPPLILTEIGSEQYWIRRIRSIRSLLVHFKIYENQWIGSLIEKI